MALAGPQRHRRDAARAIFAADTRAPRRARPPPAPKTRLDSAASPRGFSSRRVRVAASATTERRRDARSRGPRVRLGSSRGATQRYVPLRHLVVHVHREDAQGVAARRLPPVPASVEVVHLRHDDLEPVPLDGPGRQICKRMCRAGKAGGWHDVRLSRAIWLK